MGTVRLGKTEIVTSKNILIFDSNKINHKIINRLLKEYKFNIFSAYSIEDLERTISELNTQLEEYDEYEEYEEYDEYDEF